MILFLFEYQMKILLSIRHLAVNRQKKIDIFEVKIAWYLQFEFDIYQIVEVGDHRHPNIS